MERLIVNATGTISLKSHDVHEFFNQCHSRADGKFCGGSSGSGGGGTRGSSKGQTAPKDSYWDGNKWVKMPRKESSSETLKNIAKGLATVAVGAGLIYVGSRTIAPAAGKNLTKKATEKAGLTLDIPRTVINVPRTVIKNVTSIGRKPASTKKINQRGVDWGDLSGTGMPGTKKSKRVVTKIYDAADHDGDPEYYPGIVGGYKDKLEAHTTHEIVAKDGTRIGLIDTHPAHLQKMTDEQKEQILNTVAHLHETTPLSVGNTGSTAPPLIVISNNDEAAAIGLPGAGGWTVLDSRTVSSGNANIYINQDVKFETANGLMPSSKSGNLLHYVVNHEYGHRFDMENSRRMSRLDLFDNDEVRSHMSRYGKTTQYESYAEAFAEWHVSQGQTTNPAAIVYAQEEGWFGAKGEIIDIKDAA